MDASPTPSPAPAPRPPEAVAPAVRDEVSGALLEAGRPLIWRRAAPMAPEFELLQGDALFGEMEPAGGGALDATGECLGRGLGLRADVRAFSTVHVETRRWPEEAPGPSFRGLAFGWGRVTTPEGEVLRWRHAFTSLYAHVLLDAHGRELLRMRPTFLRFARTETRVTVSARAWGRADLPELLLLTWFLRAHAEARGRRVFGRRRKRPEPLPDGPTLPASRGSSP